MDGLGGAGWDNGGSMRPGYNLSFCTPGNREQPSWTSHRRHDQTESYSNRIEEHNERLTRRRQLFFSVTAAARRAWLVTSGPAPYCLCKPFSCKACLGKLLKRRWPSGQGQAMISLHYALASKGPSNNLYFPLSTNIQQTGSFLEISQLNVHPRAKLGRVL